MEQKQKQPFFKRLLLWVKEENISLRLLARSCFFTAAIWMIQSLWPMPLYIRLIAGSLFIALNIVDLIHRFRAWSKDRER